MEHITVKNILEATRGVLLCGDENTPVLDICINSKEIKEGDLFVPIIGERLDAHRFIEGALEIGAATLTSEHDSIIVSEKPYIRVNDTVAALQDIGRYMRDRLHITKVGVTGSVGKTTTREMIAAALSTAKKTYQTERNYNSQIGVPICLSRITQDTKLAVLEMGMSEEGQIARLSDLVRPDICVVSTIGIAHIEYLKTQENIRREKLSIISGMKEDGVLFLNGNDAMLAEMKGKMPCRTLFYGTESWCDYRAEDIYYENGKSYFTCIHGDNHVSVELNALGRHNVVNCVAAMGVADVLGIPMETAASGFPAFQGQRQKIIVQEGKYTIIDDTYNASTTSMRASIDVLADIPCSGKRYAVLGDMFELGEDTEKYHYEIGAYAAAAGIDEVICIGELSKHIKRAVDEAQTKVHAYSFTDKEEAAIYLISLLKKEDVVLLKASNGMQLGDIVQILLSA
ncbi:MAG: UDP-N-acetylmuramoyl-tripeptide--D-alanyl-D-alanine ligase [Lachnospiraceae bacterium]|nr:UDP-N-acetylmuramoyl-tripeptide--D-alanyl-D-alanine ligase [Lachnospiraceae bacterium]